MIFLILNNISNFMLNDPNGSPIYRYQTTYGILVVLLKKHPKTSTRQPRSEPGYHSRGSSTIHEGHIQISLKGDHKHEWIKWVKFGLNHKHRMKAKSELSDAEKPKPCLTIEHEQFHQAYNAIRSIDRAIPP